MLLIQKTILVVRDNKVLFCLFNTKKSQLEKITSHNNDVMSIYSCGPTVYDYAHIGNFRSYIFVDVLKKSLQLSGFKIVHAMNITDIDDKILNKLKENASTSSSTPQENLLELTKPFTNAFFNDLESLSIKKADFYPKATDNIDCMVEMVQKLLNKKYAYELDNSIYFDISKFKNYGKLSKLNFDSIQTGTRYNTDEYSKQNIRDFVLWKYKKEDPISWKTEIGEGRPGWHLECSAMIQNLFNGKVDIHTGGVDLIFPHHENEIAQSEASNEHEFVRYWVHCEHLLVDGKKMSKSLGNFYTLKDILKKGFHPVSLRYALLSVPYNQKMNFTLLSLQQAENSIKKIAHIYSRFLSLEYNKNIVYMSPLINELNIYKKSFLESLEQDLNISLALSFFYEFLHFFNKFADQCSNKIHTKNYKEIQEAFLYFDSVLSILDGCLELANQDIPKNIVEYLNQRGIFRENKDFKAADELRKKIEENGYKILDLKEKSYVIKK